MVIEIDPKQRGLDQAAFRVQAQCIWCEPKGGKFHIGVMFYYFDDDLSVLVNARPRRPNEPDVRHVASLYDAEIRYMDEHLGRFLDWLTEIGLDDETVLVFVSDHGEEFAEHGRVGMHGHADSTTIPSQSQPVRTCQRNASK